MQDYSLKLLISRQFMQDVNADKTTVLLLFLWTQIESFRIQLQKN